jgi:hypothetical protein
MLRVGKTLLAARMDGEVRFVTNRTLKRGQALLNLFQVDHHRPRVKDDSSLI